MVYIDHHRSQQLSHSAEQRVYIVHQVIVALPLLVPKWQRRLCPPLRKPRIRLARPAIRPAQARHNIPSQTQTRCNFHHPRPRYS